ncbi:SAYSvFN domain-containing protein 1 [Spea bombifrons]|uniref:SAYSvFN domain-containing protein 1 n=1 Tax=Spea bombifrons TaxID=233779 RepID=UPI00234A9CE3|nr:SAYSvFN domain-containing protein 1 [Spea bombifrons]
MEQKLAEYRAKKAKIQKEDEKGEPSGPSERRFMQTVREKVRGLYASRRTTEKPQEVEPEIDSRRTQAQQRGSPVPEEDVSDDSCRPPQTPGRNVVLLLKFLLWLVLLGLFVELEFGLAYFITSMFYWLYEGTRGPRQRKKGEKSAYSVFNPGCEAIQGTLTAEQFERELQYRPLAGR